MVVKLRGGLLIPSGGSIYYLEVISTSTTSNIFNIFNINILCVVVVVVVVVVVLCSYAAMPRYIVGNLLLIAKTSK